MAYNNALSTYRETRIKTASQGQLIIMLYNEAVRQLDLALGLLEVSDTGKKAAEGDSAETRRLIPGNIEKISNAVVKTQEIVAELMVSLDFEQGGEIAKNLFSLYTWFNRELMEANIEQDARRISTIRNHIDTLRGSWQEIVATNAAETANREVVGVNIAG